MLVFRRDDCRLVNSHHCHLSIHEAIVKVACDRKLLRKGSCLEQESRGSGVGDKHLNGGAATAAFKTSHPRC